MDLTQEILHVKTLIVTAITNHDARSLGFISEDVIEMVNKLERLIIQKQEEDKVEVWDANLGEEVLSH